jgi:hypothetical protein
MTYQNIKQQGSPSFKRMDALLPSTPGAKNPRWRTQLHGVWLIKIGDQVVHTIKVAQLAFKTLQDEGHTHAMLLFELPKVHPYISRRSSCG